MHGRDEDPVTGDSGKDGSGSIDPARYRPSPFLVIAGFCRTTSRTANDLLAHAN